MVAHKWNEIKRSRLKMRLIVYPLLIFAGLLPYLLNDQAMQISQKSNFLALIFITTPSLLLIVLSILTRRKFEKMPCPNCGKPFLIMDTSDYFELFGFSGRLLLECIHCGDYPGKK